MSDLHLTGAASALVAIMRARHPEYTWTAEIRERQGMQPHPRTANPDRQPQIGAGADDADTVADRNTRAASARPSDNHHGQQAA